MPGQWSYDNVLSYYWFFIAIFPLLFLVSTVFFKPIICIKCTLYAFLFRNVQSVYLHFKHLNQKLEISLWKFIECSFGCVPNSIFSLNDLCCLPRFPSFRLKYDLNFPYTVFMYLSIESQYMVLRTKKKLKA